MSSSSSYENELQAIKFWDMVSLYDKRHELPRMKFPMAAHNREQIQQSIEYAYRIRQYLESTPTVPQSRREELTIKYKEYMKYLLETFGLYYGFILQYNGGKDYTFVKKPPALKPNVQFDHSRDTKHPVRQTTLTKPSESPLKQRNSINPHIHILRPELPKSLKDDFVKPSVKPSVTTSVTPQRNPPPKEKEDHDEHDKNDIGDDDDDDNGGDDAISVVSYHSSEYNSECGLEDGLKDGLERNTSFCRERTRAKPERKGADKVNDEAVDEILSYHSSEYDDPPSEDKMDVDSVFGDLSDGDEDGDAPKFVSIDEIMPHSTSVPLSKNLRENSVEDLTALVTQSSQSAAQSTQPKPPPQSPSPPPPPPQAEMPTFF